MSPQQNRTVRLRVIAASEIVEELADQLSQCLEACGYEVLEVSRSYPLREPEEDKSRVYITAIPERK